MTDAPLPPEMLVVDVRPRFSVRILNCLHNENIRTVREVATTEDNVLIRVPNFGRKSLNELRAVIPYWTAPKSTPDLCCERCRWWDGRCRRHAPRLPPVVIECPWPHTLPTDWCGEFEHRPASDIMRRQASQPAEASHD